VQLVRRYPLLAGDHQLKRQDPLMKWDMRLLEDSPDRDSELLFAAFAPPKTGTLFLTAKR